ncbi:MAG: Gfo/Idh/MocA family oxidoreductase [Verrucomicrobia bacterium]|nr:Gfo/Idh/MocA family oxidoreductase [Verrucomicrobiota bacterium]
MNDQQHYSRREFLGGALAAGASATVLDTLSAAAADAPAGEAKPKEFARKIKLGLIGCGGRGSWLGGLFKQHGGYDIHAVADYFPDRMDKAGDKFGVDKTRRFSGLSAHKRLLESGVEAVTVVNVPHFHPHHAHAAVEAGCHVFGAKPAAVDVPGALKVQAAARLATQKKLCYLVDYQMWTDPINIEVVKRIHEGGLGKLGHIDSVGFSNPWGEPPIKTAEDRLRWWLPTTALSGDVINELSIHSINAVLWVVGKRPVSAIGRTRVVRPNPRFEFREVYLVTYEFDDGLLWTHRVQSLRNDLDWALKLDAYGDKATALVSYRGKSYLRSGPKHYGGGEVVSLYDQGAIRNIATFYDNIIQGRCDNPTSQQAGDDALTAVLGREACARRCCLTMDELIKENKKLEYDLTGLKV